MAVIYVTRESENQKAQFVALTQKDKDGRQVISGSDYPAISADVNHVRMHEGRAFFAWGMNPSATPLAAGASINIVMASNAGITPHITAGYACGGDCEFYIYQGTATTGGTAFTPVNRNRTSSTVSECAMVINPTITSLGTLIDAQVGPGGSGPKAGGGTGSGLEYVFSSLTNFHFRLTNVSSKAEIAVLTLEWYE
jgi:hypothetical protein